VTEGIKKGGRKGNGNTHDPKNATRYYRWDYQETWRFHPAFQSHYKSNGDTILPRDLINDQIYTCWRSDTSSTIVLGNSAKLTHDIIEQKALTFIGSTSEKLQNEYSILVTQYALTSEAYTFLENIQKTTQQLGSIFDAQPSQVSGNIHCTSNPALPAIGYLDIGSTSKLRIFIFNKNLPAWEPPIDPTCQLLFLSAVYYGPDSDIPVNQLDEYINYNRGAINPLIPVDRYNGGTAYTAAEPRCVDCTLRGTNVQPSYWRYQ
jgi:hypothetical protein